ncbi:hypothetical protein B23_0779 [Geobacillus thermoleovorans B23]|nr:hypothetical protein B23_0779 [Geobacillus thermoleovorans B23]
MIILLTKKVSTVMKLVRLVFEDEWLWLSLV